MSSTKLHELGFRQLDPIPTDERLTKFYESEYYHLIKAGGRANELRRLLEGGDSAKSELGWLRSTLYVDCLDSICEYSSVDGPVLDIGCGTGNLVQFFNENGLIGEGIEPSFEAANIAIGRSLNVKQATLEEIANKEECQKKYRAVTLLNVLEHVPDPVAFLKNAKALLAEGGVLIVRVPNDFSGIQEVAQQLTIKRQWWVAAPDHINYFSPSSITNVCEHLGFEVVNLFADFPMEFFLLFGLNYVDNPSAGEDAHAMRCAFERALPKEMRRSIYRALTSINIGRDLFTVVRLTQKSGRT